MELGTIAALMARYRLGRVAVALSLLAGGCESASDDFRPERVVSDLEAPDPSRRRKAYALLLRDPVALGRAGQAAVAARKAALDRSDALRDVAFDLLALMAHREGEAFVSVLADPAEPIAIRMRAAEIVDPRTVSGEAALGAIANDGGAPLPLRIQAVRSLSAGCLSAAPMLSRALADGEPWLREVAAVALSGLAQTDALKAALAPDGDPTRQAAIAAIAVIGQRGPKPVSALPQLEAALGDPVLRPAAFSALGRLGAAAVPVLIAALRSPEADTRRGAAQALEVVRYGAKEAIRPLEEVAARDADGAVRAAAASAVREIGPTFAQLAAALDGTGDARARAGVISKIDLGLKAGAPPDASVIEALRRHLRDPSPLLRSDAIGALAYAGAPALVAVPEIVDMLASDPEERVRSNAALALWPLYRAAVAPDTRALIAAALETARKDPSGDVRRCAAQSAGAVRSGPQHPFQRCEAAQ